MEVAGREEKPPGQVLLQRGPSRGMRSSDRRVAKAPRQIEAPGGALTNQRAQRLTEAANPAARAEQGPRLRPPHRHPIREPAASGGFFETEKTQQIRDL